MFTGATLTGASSGAAELGGAGLAQPITAANGSAKHDTNRLEPNGAECVDDRGIILN